MTPTLIGEPQARPQLQPRRRKRSVSVDRAAPRSIEKTDALDNAILRALKQLQEVEPERFFSADDVAGMSSVPHWAAASRITRLAVDGYLRADSHRTVIPLYRLASRGRARLARTRIDRDLPSDAEKISHERPRSERVNHRPELVIQRIGVNREVGMMAMRHGRHPEQTIVPIAE
jgi:hypothetical protein